VLSQAILVDAWALVKELPEHVVADAPGLLRRPDADLLQRAGQGLGRPDVDHVATDRVDPGNLAADQCGQDTLAAGPPVGRLPVGENDTVPRRPLEVALEIGVGEEDQRLQPGIGTFWAAILDFSSDDRALALRLASRIGLSSEDRRPSLSVQVQVPASPSTRPGRLLISTSQKPCLVRT
jgi:hypothetical protein